MRKLSTLETGGSHSSRLGLPEPPQDASRYLLPSAEAGPTRSSTSTEAAAAASGSLAS